MRWTGGGGATPKNWGFAILSRLRPYRAILPSDGEISEIRASFVPCLLGLDRSNSAPFSKRLESSAFADAGVWGRERQSIAGMSGWRWMAVGKKSKT